MESKFFAKSTNEHAANVGSLPAQKAPDLNVLEKRSSELLNKFRKTWNEAEYQEWCAIQRILHKIL